MPTLPTLALATPRGSALPPQGLVLIQAACLERCCRDCSNCRDLRQRPWRGFFVAFWPQKTGSIRLPGTPVRGSRC